MKILRIFGLIGLVIFTILFMMACGRGPESDSTSNEYLKAISTISSSVIKKIVKITKPIEPKIRKIFIMIKKVILYFLKLEISN